MNEFSAADVNSVLQRLDLGWDLRQEMESEGVRPSFWWRRLSLRQEERTLYLVFSHQGSICELELQKNGERFLATGFRLF